MATHRSKLQCFQNSFIICLETACQQPPQNTFSNEISLCPKIPRLLLFEAAVILLVSQKWSLWVTPHYLNTQKFMTHCDLKACPQYKIPYPKFFKRSLCGIQSSFHSLGRTSLNMLANFEDKLLTSAVPQLMRFPTTDGPAMKPPMACKPNCRRSSSPDLPGG